MRKIICFVALFCVMASSIAQADLVFNFRQVPAGPITQGDSAAFELVVTSTVAGQTIDGYDLALNIPSGGSAGMFTGFALPPTGTTSGGWNPDPYAPTASYGTNVFTFATTTTEYIAGILTLSTAGSAQGTYAITWDQGATGGIGPGGVPNFQFNDGSYSIVPEPAVGSLLGFVVAGLVARRRRSV